MINATLSELLGYPQDALLGKMMDLVLPIASRVFYQTHFFPLLKLQGKTEEIYFSLRTSQGEDIPILVNAVRRTQAETMINSCVVIPIRHRIQYEDEILKAKKTAEAAVAAQKQAEIALRQQYEQAVLLGEITQNIRQSLNLPTIFAISTPEIRQAVHADRAGIFQFTPDSKLNDGEWVSESVAEGFDSAIGLNMHSYGFGSLHTAYFLAGKIHAMDDVRHAELSNSTK